MNPEVQAEDFAVNTQSNLQGKLLEYFEVFEGKMADAALFVEGELPLVVTEYLQWHFYDSLLSAIVCALISLFFAACCFGIIKYCKSDDDGAFTVLVLCAAFFIILGISSIGYGKESIKTCIAPRLVIIEWVQDNIKEMRNSE